MVSDMKNAILTTKAALVAGVFILAVFSSISQADVITLKSGEKIEGRIIKEDSDKLIIHHPHFGNKVIDKSEIVDVVREAVKETEEEPDNADTSSSDSTVSTLPQPDPEAYAKFKAIKDLLKAEKPITLQEFEKKLVGMGGPVVPCILDYVSKKPLRSLLKPLFDVLVSLRDDGTVSYMQLLMQSKSSRVREAALASLEKIGDSDSIKTLVNVLKGEDSTMSLKALQSITAILQANQSEYKLFQTLENLARESESALKRQILDCLGSSKSRLAVEIILSFLGDWEDGNVRLSAVAAIGRLGFCESSICEAIKPLLSGESDHLRREAALSLGRLQDLESVEALMVLLNDESAGVRGNAYWALKNITGLRFPANKQRWNIWWKNESDKARKEREEILSKLMTGTRQEMLDALSKAGQIKLGRKEVINVLIEFVEHGDPAVRKLTCGALASLKAREAASKLLRILADPQQEVVQAAHSALKEITGLDLPADRKKWDEALNQ